jgi:O-antigen/teichoic acid export membrane protein
MTDETNNFSPFPAARGTLYLVARSLIIGGSNAVFFILIARILPSVSDVGLFQGLYSLITISVTVGGAGLSRAAIRYISFNIGAGKEDTAKDIYSAVFRLGLGISAVLALVLYLLSQNIAILFFHSANYTHLVQLASADSFFLSVIIYSTSLLYALQAFRKAVLISILSSILKLVLASFLALEGMGIGGIMIGFIVGDSIGMIIFLYALKPNITSRKSASYKEMKPLFSYSLPLYGYSLLVYLSTEIDIYLLLVMTNLSVVGIYSPAVFLATLLFFGQTALDQSLAPLFSRIYGKSGIKPLENLSKFASRYIFLVYLPIGFSLLASTPVILTGILGERFTDSIWPATVIIIAVVGTAMTPVFNNMLMAGGYTHVFIKSSTMALFTQLAISLVSIPSIGGLGAAFGRASAYVILFLFPAYKLKLIMGSLQYDKEALEKSLCGSIIMGLIIFGLNFYLSQPYYLPLNLFVGLLSYMVFLRYARIINVKDIEIMNSLLAGRATLLMLIISKVLIRE